MPKPSYHVAARSSLASMARATPTLAYFVLAGFRIQTLALPSGLKDRNDGYKTAIQVVAGPRFEPARLAAPRLLDPGPNSLFRRENSLIRQLNSLFRFLGNSWLTY